MADQFTISEVCICEAAKVWKEDGEILATGIGLLPRIAVGLAKKLHNPDLMMTDGEAFLIDQPHPLGVGAEPCVDGYMTYSRVFDVLWSGARHAMVTPTQIDKYAHLNISSIGNYAQPKVQLLGVRGFPGNSISHRNSIFIPNHSKKVFVEGSVDMVSSVGFDTDDVEPLIGKVITNLGIFDYQGNKNTLRLLSIHSTSSLDEIRDNTGFDFEIFSTDETTNPTKDELDIIRNELDPNNLRSSVIGE